MSLILGKRGGRRAGREISATTANTVKEDEAEKLMTESFSKNFIDYEEYPQSANIQNRCVAMIGSLFNAPNSEDDAGAVGTSCVGSSEAIMLAVLAMRKRWKKKRLAAGLPADNPNIIMSSGRVHVPVQGERAVLLTCGCLQLCRSAGRRRRGTLRSRRSWCTAHRTDT